MSDYLFLSDEYFMNIALQQAQRAFSVDEVPIGSIIVFGEQIISSEHNSVERLTDATAHAELLAITSANEKLGSKYLSGATIYVTVEPCVMCLGAIMWSRISRLVYGCNESKHGFVRYERVLNERQMSLFHTKLEITSNILSEQSEGLMKTFFQKKRQLR